MYSKKGFCFVSEGETTVMDGEQTCRVTKQATDSKGNTYYYVIDTNDFK